MKTQEELDNTFAGYRKPTAVTIPKYEMINGKVKELAQIIFDQCPTSSESTIALRHLQEVRMWANAAIALHTPPEGL